MARTNDIFDADAEAVPVDMIPMPGLTQGAYNPQVLVGVNANSKNPDAAKGWPLRSSAPMCKASIAPMVQRCGRTACGKLDAVKATVSGAKRVK